MPKPKRFLVFQHQSYYPSGGWGDLQGSFDTIEDARALANADPGRWDHSEIIDLETGEEVPTA